MSWRGMKGGIESAKAGHDVIMCPVSHCYFDYYQANPETSPEAIGGYTTLKKVYSFNPVPEELTQSESKFVLGGQGNLWTEYVQTPDLAQYRVLPRMTALAEVLWSGPGKNSYDDFYGRLSKLQNRFNSLGWTYAPGAFVVSIHADQKSTESEFQVILSSEKPGESIRFTLDGSDPTHHSDEYNQPFSITETITLKTALFIDGKIVGKISEKSFNFHKALGKSVKYNIPYKQKYAGNGAITLVDGLTGTTSHSDGYWQGWEGKDLDVVIDLGKPESIENISLSFLEAHGSWIFLPTDVIVSFSDEGNSFQHAKKISLSDGENFGKTNRKVVDMNSLNSSGRFVRVQAINRKICPDWHDGAGGKAWVFADEIVIQ
jgi:hexosaminidase